MSAHPSTVLLRDGAGSEAQAHLLGGEQVDEDGRVCAVLDGSGTLALALGGEVQLELARPEGEPRTVLRVRVLQHRVGRDACWYVLEVDEVDRPLLATQTDRRAYQRARPSVVAPIEAVLSAPDGTLARPVSVKDLSEGGAGLVLRPPEDLGLLRLTRLRLELRLPGEELPIDLRVRLVFRRLSGSLLHYGVSFDAYASSDFEVARDRLAAWVAARQANYSARRAG